MAQQRKKPLSRAVEEARAAAQLTQEAYAKRLGISQQALSKIENGGSASAATLAALMLRGGLRIEHVSVQRKRRRNAA